jgi:hypothetical protein
VPPGRGGPRPRHAPAPAPPGASHGRGDLPGHRPGRGRARRREPQVGDRRATRRSVRPGAHADRGGRAASAAARVRASRLPAPSSGPASSARRRCRRSRCPTTCVSSRMDPSDGPVTVAQETAGPTRAPRRRPSPAVPPSSWCPGTATATARRTQIRLNGPMPSPLSDRLGLRRTATELRPPGLLVQSDGIGSLLLAWTDPDGWSWDLTGMGGVDERPAGGGRGPGPDQPARTTRWPPT